MKRKNYLFVPDKASGEFTLSFVLEVFTLYVQVNKKIPDEILMLPTEFTKFCYYSSQFISAPTFLGIPVNLVYKVPKWILKGKTWAEAVTK